MSVLLRVDGQISLHKDGLIPAVQIDQPLEIRAGELVGMAGRSGIGKSMFIRSVVDIIDDSRIKHTHQGIYQPSSSFAYIPQDLGLLPECSLSWNAHSLSAGKSIEEVLRKGPEDFVAKIRGRKRWSPGTLSGGERRVFSLLCALASGADLLILDETFVSLDRQRLEWGIRALKQAISIRSSKGALVVSHDPAVLQACDKVFVFEQSDGVRWVRSFDGSAFEHLGEPGNAQVGYSISESYDSPKKPRDVRLQLLGRTIVAIGFSLMLMVIVMLAPKLSPNEKVRAFMPSLSSMYKALGEVHPFLLGEAVWTLSSALMAWLGAVGLSFLFWMLLVYFQRVRPLALSLFVALQGIPVAVFAPVVAIVFGTGGRALEIVIGIFISVFPIGLIGARVISAVPLDIFRAHRARSMMSRYITSLQYARGTVMRAVVSCSPLPAIGVIVAEYLAANRGLGNLLLRALPESFDLSKVYVYSLSCVFVACIVLLASTVVATFSLPRDVSAE
ncbi:MAG TPA: ATP-binding cassette domain-containing protein [Thermoanaerobaculia bacterium]